MRLFHAYANWLVSISWKRFFLLSLLLLIGALILQHLPPFSYTIGSVADGSPTVIVTPPLPPLPPHSQQAPQLPQPPQSPQAPALPGGRAPTTSDGTSDAAKDRDVVISIDRDGVRITPNLRIDRRGVRIGPGAASDVAPAASAAASAASAAASGATGSIEIKLPPGADSQAVREAVEEARAAVVEAIRDSQEKAAEAEQEAAERAQRRRREGRAHGQADAQPPPRRFPHRPGAG